MTVAELIERLSEFDPNLEVLVNKEPDGYVNATDAEIGEFSMNVGGPNSYHEDAYYAENYPDAVKQTCVYLTR